MEQVFGSRVRVDSMAKIAELELAEKEKMKVTFMLKFLMKIYLISSCKQKILVCRTKSIKSSNTVATYSSTDS